MYMDRLPPLNALKAFDAAARHLSFTRAALELCVTQAAVSQQIKNLEADLGRPVFRRVGRALLLTDAGQELAKITQEAFARLSSGVARLRAQAESGVLTVTVMPSLAAKWLVPRLGRFYARHPGIDLRLHSSWEVMDLRRSDIDLALRHGKANQPGVLAEKLASEQIFPVCSPKLMKEGPHPLRRPEDLRHHVLLQDRGLDWARWLDVAGVKGLAAHKGPSFIDSNLALDAAAAGQGVALGRTLICADDLASGRLVRPFAVSVPFAEPYWFVCLPERSDDPKIVAFHDWLIEELAAVMS